MQLPRLKLKTVFSALSIPFILLAVFAASGDALLGLQTLLGNFGVVASGGIGFVIACMIISAIVGFFYLVQDGVALWRRFRGEKDEDEDEAETNPKDSEREKLDLKKKSFLLSIWQGFVEFWLADSQYVRSYRAANFIGRLVSLVGAFAAGGGAYLAVQTLLAFFGITSGLGVLVPCALCAIGLAFAFISQDGFSLVKRLRAFAKNFNKPGAKTLKEKTQDYFKNLNAQKVFMTAASISLVAIAALAITGDAFLGVQTLLLATGLAAPQIVLLLSITLAVFLGVIYIAQEGVSLANMFQKLIGFKSNEQKANVSPNENLSSQLKLGLKIVAVGLSLVAAFAVAGGAYLGLEVLFTSVGFMGAGMIIVAATASVIAGFAYMAQDGLTFYKRLLAWLAVLKSKELKSSAQAEPIVGGNDKLVEKRALTSSCALQATAEIKLCCPLSPRKDEGEGNGLYSGNEEISAETDALIPNSASPNSGGTSTASC